MRWFSLLVVLPALVYCVQMLSEKLASLGRVLPGVDVLQLVVRVPQLLLVSSGSAVQVLVDLVNALPGEQVLNQAWAALRPARDCVVGLPQTHTSSCCCDGEMHD